MASTLVSALCRKVHQKAPFWSRGEQQVGAALAATINALAAEAFLDVPHRVGSLAICTSILVMGRGVTHYRAAVVKKATGIPVDVVRDPHLATIRGFPLLADNGALDRP